MKQPKWYRKIPVDVQAIQWTGDNYEEVSRFVNLALEENSERQLAIPTLEGTMYASLDDYIVKGIRGELYPVREDIFFDSFQEIDLK